TVNQMPLVQKNQKIRKGDMIADGPATSGGELALGRNLLVAFMPWEGCNFEDAILLSDRIVRDALLSSVHIHEFRMEARDTTMDASLRVPPGVAGKVISVRIFVRREKMATKEENRRMKDIEARYEIMTQEVREDRKARMATVAKLKEAKKWTSREAEAEEEKV